MKTDLDDFSAGISNGRTKRKLVIGGGAVALGLAVLVLLINYLAPRVIETEQLRKLIASRVGRELGGQTGLHRIDADGFAMHSRGLVVNAEPPRALTELRVHDISASFSLLELWRGKWRINQINAEHLQAAYGSEAAHRINRTEFEAPEFVPPAQNESVMSVDIAKVTIARADLFWADPEKDGGQIRGAEIVCFPDGKNLSVTGRGGFYRQAKWPETRIADFSLFYAKPSLRIDHGRLALGDRGNIDVRGEMKFEQDASLDLQLSFAQCPIAAFLKSENAKKLDGAFSGDAHLQKLVGKSGALTATGSVSVQSAVARNVTALEKVAAFTGKKELNPLRIEEVHGAYSFSDGRLKVKDFVAEARHLLRAEGSFSYHEGEIDGTFQLGVAPEIAAKFPGAREEVFTRAEDDYLWTTVKISGPLDHPTNDLQPRLIAALEKHVAFGVLAPLLKTGQAAREVINLLLPHANN